MSRVPPKLKEYAEQAQSRGRVELESVRSFLKLFGAQRRGYYIVRNIRLALRQVRLKTEPDFESAYIDAPIALMPKDPGQTDQDHVAPEITSVNAEEPAVRQAIAQAEERIGEAVRDPTYRIGKLTAANQKPVSVKPDAPLRMAVTLMLEHDYSQLPVMTTPREVKGMISWRSIGQRLALSRQINSVNEALEPHFEVSADQSLFAVINLVVEHEYVLIRDARNAVTGIVTTSDLSEQFGQLAEPYILLGEIENHLRDVIDRCFKASELAEIRNPQDGERSVGAASDLTFGDYKRLFEEPGRWDRLGLPLDRGEFVGQLETIRRIRNDVMHFDPDGIGEEDLRSLRKFVRFLQRLRSVGAFS